MVTNIKERANAWLVDDTDCYYSKSGCGQTAEIIRDLLAEVEKYERKHSKICGEGGCPPGGDCGGDDWTCKNCWAKYWEED